MQQDQGHTADSGLGPMHRDLELLDAEFTTVLERHGPPDLNHLSARARSLAQARRKGDSTAAEQLRELIAKLTTAELGDLGRSVSCLFDLANLAEDRHRIRVLRDRERVRDPEPRSESVGAALRELRDRGLGANEASGLIRKIKVDLVFTAHPTEAKRRTTRLILRRLRHALQELDRSDLLPRERRLLLERIRCDLACLWQTETVRPERPTVLGEVRRSMFAFDALWQSVPRLYNSVRTAFANVYPNHPFGLPVILSFGSWIGGDRDGNPNVTAGVTRETLLLLRAEAIRRHIDECREMANVLSLSETYQSSSDALRQAVSECTNRGWNQPTPGVHRNPSEIYRQWLDVIQFRLERSAEAVPGEPIPAGAYRHGRELAADVQLIAESLRANGNDELATGPVQRWLDRIHVFGLHLVALDIREHSERLEGAVAELARELRLRADYSEIEERARQDFLGQSVDRTTARSLDLSSLTAETRETVALFDCLEDFATTFCSDGLGALIISMAHKPSDALTMFWLGRLVAARKGRSEMSAVLPIVPIFETIDDLERAGSMLHQLLCCEPYVRHVSECGNQQICMVGYSDSTKDGGFLAANWRLYRAQREMAEVAASHNVGVVIFHGRGGSLGRGGGPAARSILSLPSESVNGKLRVTEQGEVLAERYDDPEIAFRHLEQVTYATILVTASRDQNVPDQWVELMERLSHASMDYYHRLIRSSEFLDYFAQGTPIDVIESLPIGSRPARRGGDRRLENLRAIPFTFAWTQNRHMLTAFWGMGSALESASEDDWKLLREMYREWPLFHAILKNVELGLIKADLDIGRCYAELVPGGAGAKIWESFRNEFLATRAAVLRIMGHEELLDGATWLRESVQSRNPNVDILNLIQVELLRRRADSRAKQDANVSRAIDSELRHTVQGIAAGLRTTG